MSYQNIVRTCHQYLHVVELAWCGRHLIEYHIVQFQSAFCKLRYGDPQPIGEISKPCSDYRRVNTKKEKEEKVD